MRRTPRCLPRFSTTFPFALALLLGVLTLLSAPTWAKDKKKTDDELDKADKPESTLSAGTFSGLKLRNIGPAVTSGRISDIAVHPEDSDIFYVAVASGGVWKTTNHGVTWDPIFDSQGSYSIGCITLDPHNPNVVWVGTGENNSQRSVGYGDGVYKSLDGGSSWTHMGLEASEHIAKIIVDPRNSDVIFVASQGPLWSKGGERGLFKSVDGGKTWKLALEISEHTGVSDLLMDPRDPDVLIAAAYQRRRHVWTLINGGPESGLHKSTDGGETWREINGGLPSGDIGRIGLAQSIDRPDSLYAIVEAADGGGFYRSNDRGESWHKQSDYVSGSPQYYQEIVADPHDADRIYSMDTWLQMSRDGGKTWSGINERSKHVDNHAMWIDPDDPDHLLVGCDGGLYESWDQAQSWKYYGNLPITQFYRLAVSNESPFYHVYGGTQDNFTLGGPARTTNANGIRNSDWFVTVGGDGFQPQVDPENPDIVYSQWQHGNLVRYDRASGEVTLIQPQAGPDEAPLVWNWDAPLQISPHSPTRLYFGADRLFRSDDRGQSWTAISDDLTRNLDRNLLPVMDRVWSIDAVSKNRSTSIYGNLVTLSESAQVEGLIYVGTDDGLIQVTENGGETWRKIETFPGVPERTYVNRVRASRHDPDTVFAAFNNHKMGDFKPYLLKSTDRGKTWSSIVGKHDGALPERGSVYAVEQDPTTPGLLFVGTEFGAFFTLDGGQRWVQLKGGLPTVAIRDLVIQEPQNDLVLGSFGRGFYILDDLTPLREASEQTLENDFAAFSIRDAWAYHPAVPLGVPGKSFQGDDLYVAENPPFGAVFTYYLKDGLKTLEDQRKEKEKEAVEAEEPVAYPSWEELRAEKNEEAPRVLLTVRDADGHVVRRLEGPTGSGFQRVAWDLRYPAPNPIDLHAQENFDPFTSAVQGPPAVPGTYSVSFQTVVRGQITEHGERPFTVKSLGWATLAAEDRAAAADFHQKAARLQRAVLGALSAHGEAAERVAHAAKAVSETPGAELAWADEAARLKAELRRLQIALVGDAVVARAYEPTHPGISGRIGHVVESSWSVSSAPTQTAREEYQRAADLFEPVLTDLRRLVEQDLPALEHKLEAAGAPWTPGRVPSWSKE